MAGGHDRNADTYYTWDTQEWRLLRKNPRHGITTLDDVLRIMSAHARDGAGSSEIVVVHDFPATASTFIPILDALTSAGFSCACPSMEFA